jgi:general secretion pathway protein A
MLLDYYNLREQPFGVTPDPRYLYMSASHREALASLSYGIRSGRGFLSIIAKPGMGKTTTLFQLLSQLQGSARTVFLFQTLCSPQELLHDLLRDLGVKRIGKSVADMQQQLNRILLAEARQGRKVVVVIDEAQNLDDSALEMLRMLSNFETASDKMLQIVLAGQPQFRAKLASPQLLQLRQRMSVFARLSPFNAEETHLYIEHRLCVAGYNSNTALFTPEAETLIAEHAEGVPRTINNICFNALSLGWVVKQRTIQRDVISEVLRDLDLLPETASDLQPASRTGSFIGWQALKSSAIFQQAWRRRLAVLGILLLPLIWLSGPGQSAQAGGRVSPPAVRAISQPSLPPTLPADSQNAIRADAKARPQSEVQSAKSSAPGVSTKHHTVRSQSQSQPQTDFPQASDVDQLWQQVKKSQRSDAEVKLARIYLEGTVVPRNCAQAQVLLQDATRRRNASAADLLNEFVAQCRKSE